MGGRDFTQKYANQVTEMKQLFLDFMKSVRVRAEQIANDGVDSGSGPGSDNKIDKIKLTQDGFPIIPNSINEDLSKAQCEKLLRSFLAQHYCQFGSRCPGPNLILFLQILQQGN